MKSSKVWLIRQKSPDISFLPSRTGLGTKALASICPQLSMGFSRVFSLFFPMVFLREKESLEMCFEITEIKFLNKSHKKYNRHQQQAIY